MDTPHADEVKPGAQRAGQVAAAGAGLVLLACWGLASMSASLGVYAAGWVAAVGAAASAALLYRMWTAGHPDLHHRTQTMTLGLVGWLIVIGTGMTLFRAAGSVFIEQPVTNITWAVWLLPVALVLSVGVWAWCRRAAQTYGDDRLRVHATQHLATAAALAVAEAGLVLAQQLGEGDTAARWPDVLAGVCAVGVGMAWSWLRLWKRIGASGAAGAAGADAEPDPELGAKARELLDAAYEAGDIINYDRLAIERDPEGTHIEVRLHLDGGQTLHDARERGRAIERSLEALLSAGTATAHLEPAASAASPHPDAAPAREPAPPASTVNQPDAGPDADPPTIPLADDPYAPPPASPPPPASEAEPPPPAPDPSSRAGDPDDDPDRTMSP